MSDDLVPWVLMQWKRRGLIDDAAGARAWLATRSAASIALVRRRRLAGWLVPRG